MLRSLAFHILLHHQGFAWGQGAGLWLRRGGQGRDIAQLRQLLQARLGVIHDQQLCIARQVLPQPEGIQAALGAGVDADTAVGGFAAQQWGLHAKILLFVHQLVARLVHKVAPVDADCIVVAVAIAGDKGRALLGEKGACPGLPKQLARGHQASADRDLAHQAQARFFFFIGLVYRHRLAGFIQQQAIAAVGPDHFKLLLPDIALDVAAILRRKCADFGIAVYIQRQDDQAGCLPVDVAYFFAARGFIDVFVAQFPHIHHSDGGYHGLPDIALILAGGQVAPLAGKLQGQALFWWGDRQGDVQHLRACLIAQHIVARQN